MFFLSSCVKTTEELTAGQQRPNERGLFLENQRTIVCLEFEHALDILLAGQIGNNHYSAMYQKYENIQTEEGLPACEWGTYDYFAINIADVVNDIYGPMGNRIAMRDRLTCYIILGDFGYRVAYAFRCFHDSSRGA